MKAGKHVMHADPYTENPTRVYATEVHLYIHFYLETYIWKSSIKCLAINKINS